ncbi:hypothetical protein ACFFLM_20705 [Deinococcus oregonensis]|uniref:Uncharacterized protein n=1 Tax=Deinococcus oregonensis TaxID=1805970 RepID=A0ABV6B3Q5_9DEIO
MTLATLGAALSCVYSWKDLGWHGLFWLVTACLLWLLAKAFAPLTFSDLTRTLVYVTVLIVAIGGWSFIVWMWDRQRQARA